ncbi:MAG TPA: phosphotransferase [Thermomicrobiales bacterium]|nr:phosphotransferase [Thermomicrobiales bacterium]
MRDDPHLDPDAIAASLDAHYGLRLASVQFLPLGYDPNAVVYEVRSADGAAWFLKVRFGPVHEPGLLVPRALAERGVPNILAPVPTRSADLWCPLAGSPGYAVVLYPFVRGEDAAVAGLSDDQWRAFGSTLRAVHDGGLDAAFRDRLRVEGFALPSAAPIGRILALVDATTFDGATAERFAAFWRANAARIRDTLARAEALGARLRAKRFEVVLCHADIHAANVLVGGDGRIHLVDWDGPLIAPRERDLLFVIGSRIARPVTPREEALFFEGYGPVAIDPDALVYYRYERIVEDLGEFGKSVFLDPHLSEEARRDEADLAMGLLAPGADLDRAETVDLRRVPVVPG